MNLNLIALVFQEMWDDDANTDRESERLLATYDEADAAGKQLIDDVLVSLCGWTLPTLRRRLDGGESENAGDAKNVIDPAQP
jgi:hypothetical protein